MQLFLSQPTRISDTNNMLGLKVAACVCIIFINSIEAAPQPDPSPCWPVELCPGRGRGCDNYRNKLGLSCAKLSTNKLLASFCCSCLL